MDVSVVGSLAEFSGELRRLLREYERRIGHGVNRKSLARKINVSPSSLYAYLSGTTLPPAVALDRLLAAIEVPAADMSRLADARERLTRRLKPTPAPLWEMPADVTAFAGRHAELAQLNRLRVATRGAPVVVVSGTAGVGKTGLAVRWAHQKRHLFPDGGLCVNLRGYDPGDPLAASEALALLLRHLGVPSGELPAGAEERGARYRELLRGRRMLLVLDNARDVEQVRPLLPPGNSGCFTIVTSRDDLAGLVILDGAHRIGLDPLARPDAVALLRTLLDGRVAQDPDDRAAADLVDRCAGLPLTVRICAEHAARRRAVPLADLALELRDEPEPLDWFSTGGDCRTQVRAVFSWSYRHLCGETAAAWRMLALAPGPDVDVYAAAAMLDVPLARARRSIKELVQAHLLTEVAPNRYAMHDLLRAYARERARHAESPVRRQQALGRLLDYYVAAASLAMELVVPHERDRLPAVPRPRCAMPVLADAGRAARWLDTERRAMVAAAVHQARYGHLEQTCLLSALLSRYLDTGAHHDDARQLHTHASRIGDPQAKARALAALGVLAWRTGHYPAARDHLEQARHLFRTAGDRYGEGRALINLGVVADLSGCYDEALDHHQSALAIARDIGDRTGQGIALGNLAVVLDVLDRTEEAFRLVLERLAIAREVGDRNGEAITLNNLGGTSYRLGRPAEAIGYHRQSLGIALEIGALPSQISALNGLGEALNHTADPEQARDHYRRAVELARATEQREGLAHALNGLGTSARLLGSPADALTCHHQALDLSHHIGDRFEQARAHDGIAQALVLQAQPDAARQHWEQAHTLYRDLGLSTKADAAAAELQAVLSQSQLRART